MRQLTATASGRYTALIPAVRMKAKLPLALDLGHRLMPRRKTLLNEQRFVA